MPTDDRVAATQGTEERAELLAGRYRMLQRIDAGGAGEVWRARDERLGREVAVKLLGADADEAFRERFADEARRAAQVSHPNVVTVFDEGRDDGRSFMVMEYVHGRTLRDVVSARGPLPAYEAARIVAQVAAALDAAHEAGVIHCDVKPANVMVDDHGHAKLADFGIARAARGPGEHELIGTARYIAPERVLGDPPTEQSDIYSLGLVAYELLAGRPAYAELETDDLLRLRLDGPPPSLRGRRVGVSDEVDRVIARALARDARARYASAGQFARALTSAADRGDATSMLPEPKALRRRSGPRIDTTAALLAVILVLAGTLIVFAAFRGGIPGGPGPTASPSAQAGRTPSVVGKTLKEARPVLLGAGFGLMEYAPESGATGAPCAIVRQVPAAGASFQRGATAQVFYVAGRDCLP